MLNIKTLFTHGSTYILPGSIPVVAHWWDAGHQPQWWFIEQFPNGQRGHLVAAVLPLSRVYNYQLDPDASHPVIYKPYLSDLTIADIRCKHDVRLNY